MATLGPAVASLRASLTLLDSSISILDEGVADLPRLRKVLQTQRHFELLPETKLKAAQQSLADEISPAVEQLLSTVEAYVSQLARREQGLKARYELQEGRMRSQRNSLAAAPTSMASTTVKAQGGPSGRGAANQSDQKIVQLKKLQQKRDQLESVVERLELQAKQKERNLRKSMAFVREID